MEPYEEQKPQPADRSRLNIDDGENVRGNQRLGNSKQGSNGIFATVVVVALVLVGGYLFYSKNLMNPQTTPTAMQNNTMAPSTDTTGSTKLIVPLPPSDGSPTQPNAGGVSTQPKTP